MDQIEEDVLYAAIAIICRLLCYNLMTKIFSENFLLLLCSRQGTLGRVTLKERIKAKGDVNESRELGVQFFKTGQDSPKALGPAEKSLRWYCPPWRLTPPL